MKQIGGTVIDAAAVRTPNVDAAAAGMHGGVAAAIADVFEAWLGSLADGGLTIERLGWVLDEWATTHNDLRTGLEDIFNGHTAQK
ncbi:MAG: hypothetical protein ACRD29_12045, partial [Acidimicrobiales bacterium]